MQHLRLLFWIDLVLNIKESYSTNKIDKIIRRKTYIGGLVEVGNFN